MGAQLSYLAKRQSTTAPEGETPSDAASPLLRKHSSTSTQRKSVFDHGFFRLPHTSSSAMASTVATTACSQDSRSASCSGSVQPPSPLEGQLAAFAENRLLSFKLTLGTANPIEYVWLGGRHFQRESDSVGLLPSDEEENGRLRLRHGMIRFAIQGNYLAPVSHLLQKGAVVLDAACGSGSWTLEIADEYPKSMIVGVDRLPTMPRCIKPANCVFRQCNIQTRLPFEDATFDYVFMRFVSHATQTSHWDPLIDELVRVLKQGGWIELVESDPELHHAGPIMQEYNRNLLALLDKRGLDSHAGWRLGERLKAHSELSNLVSTFISCPGGQWAGKIGQLALQSWKAYYHALRPQLCLENSISVEEYDAKLQDSWAEVEEYKPFENVHLAFAQKGLT